MLKLLEFSVQDIHLSIDFRYVERVLPLPLLERVPTGPFFLAGLMNLRGKSIPVIDLGMRLGLMRSVDYSLNAPVLLCTDNDTQVGLIIDKIFGFVEVENESVQMHEKFDHSPFLGALPLEAGISLLLNPAEILAFSLTGENKVFDINKLAKR